MKTVAAETAKAVVEAGEKVARTIAKKGKGAFKVLWSRRQIDEGGDEGKADAQQLPEELKIGYLEALVWLTYQDDRQIDASEVSELHILMTAYDVESRHVIRDRIADPSVLDIERIVSQMQKVLERESAERMRTLWHLLLKSAVRLELATSENGTTTMAGGIKQLAELLDVPADEVSSIEEECKQEREILAGRVSDALLAGYFKKLVAGAAGIGVPIGAVSLSGSVTGLSAAGVTSGLAALGFGGLLGLSAMVTGVGAVAGGGVVVFMSTRWLMGRASRNKSAHREILLQEVLRIHQKAIANLADDIAAIGGELVELTANVEANKCVIVKLAQRMELLGKALGQLRGRENALEHDLEAENDRQEQPSAGESDGEADSTGS